MRLNDVVAEYVAYKRAIGMRFDTDANILGSFCRHVGDVPLISITADQVRNYLDGSTPVSSYWQRKYTAISGLYRFALPRGYARASPLPSHRPQFPPPLVPYIYSQAELKRLLDATPSACGRQVPLEAYVFRTLILLLYGACLRLGEALRLTQGDVDIDQAVLCVRETKFYKTRLVPLGQDLGMVLNQYVQRRNITHSKESSAPFFCFLDGRILSQSAVRSAFRRLRVQAGYSATTALATSHDCMICDTPVSSIDWLHGIAAGPICSVCYRSLPLTSAILISLPRNATSR